ncbi:hypothetical protein MPSEU_000884000 [Mayamaea pseudoterrestris]|nr:hypothetical protein MPSEU_000884000 [Mayamaea pseudoterrestris]
MTPVWQNETNEAETGLFDGELMPMLDEIIFDSNYMSGLQLNPYDNAGAVGDDGLDVFRPAVFLNDIKTILDGSLNEATAAADASNAPKGKLTTKSPKKRKASGSPSVSPKRSRTIAASKATNKSHMVPSSPATVGQMQGVAASVAATDQCLSNSNMMDKKNSVDPPGTTGLKATAQAAVTALMGTTEANKDKRASDNVDTSTAHVKALTGNNWVYASSSIANAAPMTNISSSSSASLASTGSQASSNKCTNRNVRRQPLTADERASQNRDRNREHARNTRLRKKAYVDELKKTLVELVAQRDEAEQEKRRMDHMEAEQKEVRFRVIEEFLKLRGTNEASISRWSAILDEHFSLTLPATHYRNMVHSGANTEQVIKGVSDCMADASHLSGFLCLFGQGAVLKYTCDRDGFVMDGTIGILEWEANIVGTERYFKGSFRASFCPTSNKLVSAKLMFDTGVIHSVIRPSMKRNVSMVEYERANADEDGSEADAILSSIGIPRLVASSNMNKSNLVTPSVGSSGESEKDDTSTDGSLSGSMNDKQEL